jgi:toxin-antitoxin system PIN domain toxin
VIVVDVNVLVAMHRRDHPGHLTADAALRPRLARRGAGVLVPGVCWAGLARIATNHRVFPSPSTPQDVQTIAHQIMAAPGYQEFADPPGLNRRFFGLCVQADATGNLVADAYIAAIAQGFACPVLTFDTDFYKFDRLEVELLKPASASPRPTGGN